MEITVGAEIAKAIKEAKSIIDSKFENAKWIPPNLQTMPEMDYSLPDLSILNKYGISESEKYRVLYNCIISYLNPDDLDSFLELFGRQLSALCLKTISPNQKD